jgi:hypothetical protein
MAGIIANKVKTAKIENSGTAGAGDTDEAGIGVEIICGEVNVGYSVLSIVVA